MNKLTYISATLILILGFGNMALAGNLTLHVETASDTGTIRAAVYDSQKSFEAGEMIAGSFVAARQGNSILVVNLKPGIYGITLYHDQNGNEELDTNLLGAPNEPFGFSNNPNIGFSTPNFDAFKFEYDGESKELSITLNGS